MKHKASSMKKSTLKPNEVWYVDSGASNHMTSHIVVLLPGETEQPGVVEIRDDTLHPIEHVG